MELVDRFLSCSVKTSHYYLAERENFQLLSIAAFYVSVKTMERAVFGSDLLVLVSNGVYTKEEIERTEKELLQGLGWRVNPPTATQFACLIMSLVTPLIANMHDELVARVLNEIAYQAENSVRDYSLSQERSSSTPLRPCLTRPTNCSTRASSRNSYLRCVTPSSGISPIRSPILRSCR